MYAKEPAGSFNVTRVYPVEVEEEAKEEKEEAITPGVTKPVTSKKDEELSAAYGFNFSLNARHARTAGSRECELEGALALDVFQSATPRYLLNNVGLHIRLWPSNDSFRLMADDVSQRYTVKILDASLKVTEITVDPGVITAHDKLLKEGKMALYPYFQSSFRVYNIGQGMHSWSETDIFQGEIPSKVYAWLVTSRAFNGDYKRNPLKMEHADLTSVSLSVNNVCQPAGRPIPLNFKEKLYNEAFLQLYKATHKYGKNTSCWVNSEDFGNGTTLFCWDLDGHEGVGDYLPLPKVGTTKISGTFDSALPEAMTLVLYGQFARSMNIDQARNVYA